MHGTSRTTAAGVTGTAGIRAGFRALDRRENGVPVAYFDGPGGTQTPDTVVNAVSDYLVRHNANTHWNYPSSAETDAILESAREAVADHLGAAADEVVFGANMTTLTYHVARALGREWRSGDEVVVTELDHHANVAPWTALAAERGIAVRVARMDTGSGTLDTGHLETCINPRTRLLAVAGASNALGTINNVPLLTGLAKSVGALTFVDAVHWAPHALLDAHGLGCDMLACSAYKVYGPHIGALFVRRELLESLDAPKLEPAPDTGPERLETGTLNHEGIAGAAAAIDYLASLAGGDTRRVRLARTFEALHERGTALLERMWDGLSGIDGVRLYGPPPDRPRTPTLAFTITNIPSSEVATRLAREAVFVSHGDFYAATVVERLGLGSEGLVRAGCACYTSAEEVDRLVDGVRRIARAGP